MIELNLYTVTKYCGSSTTELFVICFYTIKDPAVTLKSVIDAILYHITKHKFLGVSTFLYLVNKQEN